MTTKLETGQFNTEKSEQTPRQMARHEIETYIKGAELEGQRVQALDRIRKTIRKRKNGVRGYIRAYNEVNELAGKLQTAVFGETMDPDNIGSIDAKFAVELQKVKNNIILAKIQSHKK